MNDTIIFNGERIDISAIRARISQERAEDPSLSVIIKPEGESNASALVSVINSAHQAGVDTISVIE